jgi:hypothetical protein
LKSSTTSNWLFSLISTNPNAWSLEADSIESLRLYLRDWIWENSTTKAYS